MSAKRQLAVEVALTAAVAWLAVLHSVSVANELNADAIYPLTLASDWIWSGPGVEWSIPPAGGLPEVLLAWLGLLFGRQGFANISMSYAVFCAALFLSSRFFLAATGIARMTATAAGFVATVALVLCGERQEQLTVLYMSPNHHQYAICFALVTLGLVLAGGSPRWLAATLALGVFWDPIVIVQAAAPAAILLAARSGLRARGLASIAIGVAAGLVFREATDALTPLEHGDQPVLQNLPNAPAATWALIVGFPEVLANSSLWRGTLGLGALAWIAVTLTTRARRDGVAAIATGDAAPALGVALASAAAVLGPGLFGTWSGPAYYRQQLPLFFLPGLMVAAASIRFVASRFQYAGVNACAVATLFCVGFNEDGFSRLFGEDLLIRRHKVLLSELRARDIESAVVEYWDAKPLWLLSRGTIQVCAVGQGGEPFQWIANKRWCDWAIPQPAVAFVAATAGKRGPLEFRSGRAVVATEKVGEYEFRYYDSAPVATQGSR